MSLLENLETAQTGTEVSLNELLAAMKFNEQGLVPAIAQDSQTHTVLMLAWMDEQSIRTTLKDGFATYYSRSRKAYWRKGESSGHLQKLCSMRFDCDADTVLLTVDQIGPACHTERQHCFYLKVDAEKVIVAPAE